MMINKTKTKAMVYNRHDRTRTSFVVNDILEEVKEFTYLVNHKI